MPDYELFDVAGHVAAGHVLEGEGFAEDEVTEQAVFCLFGVVSVGAASEGSE